MDPTQLGALDTDFSKLFSVIYTKLSTKKRKIYSDGTLLISKKGSSFSYFLRSEDNIDIARKVKNVYNSNPESSLKTGQEIDVGQYSITVETEMNVIDMKSTKPIGTFKSKTTNVSKESRNIKIGPISAQKFSKERVESRLPNKKDSVPCLDTSIARKMRSHQLEAADFILKCLYGMNSEPEGRPLDLQDDDFEGQNMNVTPSPRLVGSYTGAILGDEMGLGKTLTAISVLWSVIRNDRSKAVIVCPSSLIDNWEKEIRKWLGIKLRPLCVRPIPGAQEVVNNFQVAHANISPVLIISYELFRKYASDLNEINQLELLVCDEAHRLKNAEGTKTTEAIKTFRARRRLMLTGTPLQNDLEELYAVVSSAVPGFLGSLSDFRREFQSPILQGKTDEASETMRSRSILAMDQLRARLSQIMIRRTQNEVLSKLLPPKKVWKVFVGLSDDQLEQYNTTCQVMLSSLGRFDDDNEEATEGNSIGGYSSSSEILSGLMRLRQICNGAKDSSPRDSEKENRRADTSKNSMDSRTLGIEKTDELADLIVGSTKLQLIYHMLRVLWQDTVPYQDKNSGCQRGSELDSEAQYSNKVVVVSSFTTTLDLVQELAVIQKWQYLRLDGSVPSEQRQRLVDAFNRQSDPRRLFLLSSKAGGVGINLIGGCRLIMMDCDWNPAVDKQAMARVWRDGQKMPVSIYRLVAADTVEESILRRQYEKDELADVVRNGSTLAEESSDKIGLPPLRSRKQLEDLLHPTDGEAGSRDGDRRTYNVIDAVGIESQQHQGACSDSATRHRYSPPPFQDEWLARACDRDHDWSYKVISKVESE